MSDTELDGLDEFTGQVAEQIESFLIALGAVARGDMPESALSILLLEVSQLMLAGGRLGARNRGSAGKHGGNCEQCGPAETRSDTAL